MEEKQLSEEEKREYNKLIKKVWGDISRKINNITWEHYADKLFKIVKEESKQHDNFRGEDIKRGLTISEETRYFCVLYLVRYAYNFEGYKPKAQDYLHVKKSLFYAFGIASEYANKIKEAVTLEEANKINAVSYTQLI